MKQNAFHEKSSFCSFTADCTSSSPQMQVFYAQILVPNTNFDALRDCYLRFFFGVLYKWRRSDVIHLKLTALMVLLNLLSVVTTFASRREHSSPSIILLQCMTYLCLRYAKKKTKIQFCKNNQLKSGENRKKK